MLRRLARAGAAAFLLLAAAGPADALDAAGRAEVEEVVRSYLREHPEVILEAIEALQAKNQEAGEARTRALIVENRDRLTNDPSSPFTGNAQGDVTIVEFFDYNCGYCKSVQKTVMQFVRDDGKTKLVFKELPILSETSLTAAKAALAARLQGRYVEMHVALMAHRGAFTDDTLAKIAQSAGLDPVRMKSDMDKPEVAAAIAATKALAETLGIGGTPAFVVGDALVPGAVPREELARIVAEQRRK